jgi:hypothetical protein
MSKFSSHLFLFSLACLPVQGANNANAIGTVNVLQPISTSLQYEPETVVFSLSETPTARCGLGHRPELVAT